MGKVRAGQTRVLQESDSFYAPTQANGEQAWLFHRVSLTATAAYR